jgi:multidrug efflux system membrane fusion protein
MSRTHWIAAVALAAAACGGDAPPPAPPLPVTAVQVGGSSDDRGGTRYSGAIKADQSVDVAFRVSGIVEAITQVRGADGRLRAVQDGDPVRKGQVLARLRQAEYRDQVAETDAALRQAQADYERASQLYENRSISKAEYDAAYARYTAGQARQSQAAIALGDATLRAPLDGVILRRSTEVGSLAGASAPAFSIADTRVVKVVFGVPDVVVARLRLGQTVPIQAEALPGVSLEGRITRISPSADPNSRVFEVEAALPNPRGRLKVGMLATLLLGTDARDPALLVPLAAIVRPAGDTAGYAVYVIADSAAPTARLRRVRLGEVSGNLIAVREGLRTGEQVVVRGATIVTDGQPVQILH